MSRLVLDTNCLIQIVSPRSNFHSLWDSFVRGENTLCVSNLCSHLPAQIHN